jgi:MYXO-CTERM domain-containing protein
MSTFSGDTNFGTGWLNSDAYHAVSQTNVLGPYVRQDYVYSNNGSHKGHNVSAVELPDGYAVVVSEIVPFTIYKSSSLDGPWTACSPTSQVGASNISLFPRHDGKFEIVERNGTIAISDTLCGTYVKQKPTCAYTQNATDSIYPKRTTIPNVPNPAYTWQEDPHIWRSGGVYHVIYSGSGDRVGWHVYSADGISWKDNGYAWSPRDYQKIFCYEGGTTCSQWYKMERPSVVLQDGHPTHITWAVADVDKDNQVLPGTNHGTKIVVVPFDGVTFDNDFGVPGSSGGGGGTGGASSSGGAGGNNGTAGTAAGTGGLTSTGGGNAVAGSTSVSGTGGTAPTGGVPTVAGGAGGTGGAVSNNAGGQLAAGGPPAVGGAPASGGSNAAASSDAGGCGCRVAGGPAPSKSLAILGILGLLGRRRSKRRNKQ